MGATAGQSDQELWCISTGSAHNVVADNILGDNMKVDLFSDAGCQYRIAGFETDGCHVIPSDVSNLPELREYRINEFLDCHRGCANPSQVK